jgi:hypothetical protein
MSATGRRVIPAQRFIAMILGQNLDVSWGTMRSMLNG